MEGLQNAVRNAMSISQDPNVSSTVGAIASTFEKAKASFKNLASESSSSSSSASSNSIPTEPPPALLLARQPRNTVSLSACSKLCAVCFVAGVIVGYTVKRRVRRWASKILRRLKDD